ncbi:MAG: mandelate racemase/muconate lactonizing enzyme family protein [Candidatus Brocadiia bacterium]|nr:mandelate racemase/muconate lactonizing enzyme family protein [Candidatus Brocadiia bacterium]
MKITEIEVIPLRVPYEERIRKRYHYFGMSEDVTIYKFHTDAGLIGLGEGSHPPFEQARLEPYIGTDPFDHVMGPGPYNLDMACYDLMGKHLGVPAWKLMGQQVRDWAAMGWWMPSMSPEDTAEEVRVAVERGYRSAKCKGKGYFDVVEQSRAIQEVAPPDFGVEYDFNGGLLTVEKALPVLRELEKYPVVKGLEDPICPNDLEGWRRLRAEISIPFYLHGVWMLSDGPSHQVSGPWLALRAGDIDGALCGHEDVRSALAAGWIFGAANTPIVLQYVGTGITTAFQLQLAAVMPTATLPGVTLSHTREDDLIVEPQEVHRGFMKVPEGSGLGVELDEEAVERYRHTPVPEWPRHIAVLTFPGGVEHYYRNLWEAEHLMKLGVEEPFVPGVRIDEWEDDGSDGFDGLWKRLQESDRPIWEL